jgi:hypothetical protein
MGNPISIAGERYGRLIALSLASAPGEQRRWLCQCDCGRTKVVSQSLLRTGTTSSCGCLRKEQLIARSHASADPETAGVRWPSEYAIWRGMIARCHNPNAKDYANYGGRGIAVCASWRASFDYFFDDMGPRPSPQHQIDRIDNDGWYDLDNCEWHTVKENCRNKRNNVVLACFGQTLTLAGWAERTGISRELITHRLKAGWSIEEALTAQPSKSLNSRHARKRSASHAVSSK